MTPKFFEHGYVVRRTREKDRGNGTKKKIVRYLTFRGGWAKRGPNRSPLRGHSQAHVWMLHEAKAKARPGDVLVHTSCV